MENNSIFRIPLFSWYYVAITLIFILMKFLKMIDWTPLWILSPLWIPTFIAFTIIFVLYLLNLVAFLISLFYKKL